MNLTRTAKLDVAIPFIDLFQYTASMGFFPYGAQNCQI